MLYKYLTLPAIVASNVQASVYISSGVGKVNAALYDNYNGQPWNLLAVGVTVTTQIGWNNITVPIDGRPAGVYYLAFIVNNTARMTYNGSGLDKYNYRAYTDGFSSKPGLQNWLGDLSANGYFCHY